MKIATKYIAAMALCTLLAGQAGAGSTTLTFEGLQNFEGVANYYNGGKGSLGSGPGPTYGITFDSNALAYIPGAQTGKVTPFPNDPSPSTVLLLGDLGNRFAAGYPLTMTMDVSGGFAQSLSFYYINIANKRTRVEDVQVFSGLDGSGTRLAEMDLHTTPEAFAGPLTISFTGTAHSVVFAGGNDQLALDNIRLLPAPVPEPSTMVLLVSSLPFLLVARRAANRFPADCPAT